MQLHQIPAPVGAHKRRKIVGRGRGSGHGKLSGRGRDGQGSRSGRGILRALEGGQMPIIRRLPKVGFNSKNPTIYQLVNLRDLNRFKENTVVDAKILKAKGLIKNIYKPFKILGDGEIKKPLQIQAPTFSKSAQDKIVKAGGKAEIVAKISREKTKESSIKK